MTIIASNLRIALETQFELLEAEKTFAHFSEKRLKETRREGASLSKTFGWVITASVTSRFASVKFLVGEVEEVDKNAEFCSDILPHFLTLVNMWFILHRRVIIWYLL